MSDLQSGEFIVRNRHGDIGQSGEMVTVETPYGPEALPTHPVILRQGDHLEAVWNIVSDSS